LSVEHDIEDTFSCILFLRVRYALYDM
jgi:hypothetical protein